jgi:hypothetical protein
MIILDISNMSKPRMISRWDNSPPYYGFTHTVVPLFKRNLFIATDETTKEDGSDLPKLMWVLDGRDESNPIPIATLPAPSSGALGLPDKRVGAHNIHENTPAILDQLPIRSGLRQGQSRSGQTPRNERSTPRTSSSLS